MPETCDLTEEQIGDDTIEVLGSYLIGGDNLLCSPSETDIETFGIYTTLNPADDREGVIGFVAIDQESSEGTDGAMQDVSGPDGEPTGERYLALDVTGSSVELDGSEDIAESWAMFVYGDTDLAGDADDTPTADDVMVT